MDKLFAKYISKQQYNKALIASPPTPLLKLVVIIPAFNEPNITNTLLSLKKGQQAKYPTEVIVLINHSELAFLEIIEQNKSTFATVKMWIDKNSTEHLSFHCIMLEDLPKKHAGAGLARKIAMDEAVRRFKQINNFEGVIVSLDADTLVSPYYITSIQNAFIGNKNLNCAVFNFEHIITKELTQANKDAIVLYELYLRYFKQALAYTGFPYSFHTIGSCFAVRADTYVKQGGMNRRQGGEDFYFLHKVFPLGGTQELTNITVYPSSRVSDRVPFGTGPALKKIIEEGDLFTYKPSLFTELKKLFSKIPELFDCNKNGTLSFYEHMHSSLQSFIPYDEFEHRIIEINSNSSSLKSFTKRFYTWFDAFKIIKYLNFAHQTVNKSPIYKAITELLKLEGKLEPFKNEFELLEVMRKRDL